jgi:hypothetical protein
MLGADAGPGLFRAGDIGVSSEWRDLTLDWTPLLTAIGVSIYTYLRDMYDQQRALFPFLNPVGPLKQRIQQVHGKETDWALRGPEYVLAAVGLVHVETSYGPSPDPDNPQRTRVAYYSIGRLQQPALDWAMLEHVLNALLVALDPPQAHDRDLHKKASAALQSLKHAGFLQNCPPDRLFHEFGAWPRLLPTLVMDERWGQLFTHLHGEAATLTYRRQARAWAEYAERTMARLVEQNERIRALVQDAQRQGSGGRGPLGGPTATGSSDGAPYHVAATQAAGATQGACVAGESLGSRQPVQVTRGASATRHDLASAHATKAVQNASHAESLTTDQLTLRSRRGAEHDQKLIPTTRTVTERNTDAYSDQSRRIELADDSYSCGEDDIPLVEPHIRDGELTTKRLDATFWTEVNFILYGVRRRYPHTAGEKKVAERRFSRQGIATGVALAALRAITPIYRPHSFGAAVQLPAFHACVQQALALLPQRTPREEDGRSFASFVHAYRTVGLVGEMRDVNAADYGLLASLYEHHREACWEALSRVSHAAQPIKLTPLYLKRAVANNERAAAAAMLQPVTPLLEERGAGTTGQAAPSVAEDDPRVALLRGEGVDPRLLTDAMSLAYLQAWVAEANARRSLIKSRVGWLIWGIESGYSPDEHPRLPRISGRGSGTDGAAACSTRSRSPAGTRTADTSRAAPDLAAIWQAVLADLQREVAPGDFETWLRETELQLVDRDDQEAVVSASNIFARDQLQQVYLPDMERVLAAHLGASYHINVVIAAACLW